MASDTDAAIDLERFELRLFPNDPPPACDLQADERRLRALLELHPTLRQALREGCVSPQVAFATAALSPGSQEDLAALYQREGELRTADLKRAGGSISGEDAAGPEEGATASAGVEA